MRKINNIKLKSLEQTRAFYLWELKKEDLTEIEKSKYLLAIKSIEKIIKDKKDSLDYREKIKHKRSIPDDHKKAVFQNSKRGY